MYFIHITYIPGRKIFPRQMPGHSGIAEANKHMMDVAKKLVPVEETPDGMKCKDLRHLAEMAITKQFLTNPAIAETAEILEVSVSSICFILAYFKYDVS
jgi:hypothetical protein